MSRDGAASDAATWCDQHDRRECSKDSKRTKQRCHQPAIKGLDACKTHCGERLDAAKARGQANLMRAAFAEIASAEYADPGDVLLWAVTVSARQVAWLRSLISDRLTLGGGSKQSVDSDALAALVRLEQDERTALTRAAKMAIDAGIADRQIRMAERVAEQLVAVLRGVVTELGHDPAEPAVASVVRKHLVLITGQSDAA